MDPILSTVVAALIAGCAAMWKKLSSSHAELSARNDECERDRDTIREELEAVKTDVAIFKSCPSDPCGARRAFLLSQTFSTNNVHPHEK